MRPPDEDAVRMGLGGTINGLGNWGNDNTGDGVDWPSVVARLACRPSQSSVLGDPDLPARTVRTRTANCNLDLAICNTSADLVGTEGDAMNQFRITKYEAVR